jgi:hypothetical protein
MSKRILFTIAAVVVALVVVAGCASRMAAEAPAVFDMAGEAPAEFVEGAEAEKMVVEELRVASGSGGANYAAIERLIIRNASLDIVVRDTQVALDAITELTEGLGGYVVESSSFKYQEGLRGSITIRVPAERLGSALTTIRDMATEVRSENFSGQDVTDEYVDLSSSLRNLEAVEQELLELLTEVREKTRKAEDVLSVYRELTSIRAQIEQIKGRMEYLQESAALSRVSIELTPDELAQPIQVGRWQPGVTLNNAIERLIEIMQWLVDAAIVIVFNVIPVLIVLAIPVVAIIYAIRAIRKRRRARKAKAGGAGEGGGAGEAGGASEEAEATDIEVAE